MNGTGTDALPENFAAQFELIADLAPDRPAVFYGDRSLTFGEFDALASQLASHLHALGIRDGDRVGIAARNSPEYLIALTGLFKIGGVPFNVNYRYRVAEIRYLLAETGARGVIADAEFADTVREAAAGMPDGGRLVVIGDKGFGPRSPARPGTPAASWATPSGSCSRAARPATRRRCEGAMPSGWRRSAPGPGGTWASIPAPASAACTRPWRWTRTAPAASSTCLPRR